MRCSTRSRRASARPARRPPPASAWLARRPRPASVRPVRRAPRRARPLDARRARASHRRAALQRWSTCATIYASATSNSVPTLLAMTKSVATLTRDAEALRSRLDAGPGRHRLPRRAALEIALHEREQTIDEAAPAADGQRDATSRSFASSSGSASRPRRKRGGSSTSNSVRCTSATASSRIGSSSFATWGKHSRNATSGPRHRRPSSNTCARRSRSQGQEIDSLRETLHGSNRELEHARATLTANERELSSLRETWSTSSGELSSLRETLAASGRELDELRAEQATARADARGSRSARDRRGERHRCGPRADVRARNRAQGRTRARGELRRARQRAPRAHDQAAGAGRGSRGTLRRSQLELGKSLYFERIVKRRKGLVGQAAGSTARQDEGQRRAEGRPRRAANLQGHGRDEPAQAAATHRQLEGRSQGSRGDRQAPSRRHGREGRADERDLARRGARGAPEHAGRADSVARGRLKTARLSHKAERRQASRVERLTKELETKNQVIVQLQADTDEQQRKLSKLRGSESRDRAA